MKVKHFLVALALMLGASSAWADNTLSVKDVTISPNGKAVMAIEASFEKADFIGFQFDVQLPEGVSVIARAKGFEGTTHSISMSKPDENVNLFRFLAADTENNGVFPTGNFVLLNLTLQSDGSLTDGSSLAGVISEITFSDKDQQGTQFNNVNFSVKVDKYATVIDEDATELPLEGENIGVRVKRTIAANEASTICLPFAMNADQVKAAFGDDVKLAEFNGYEVGDDNIQVNFTSGVTAIAANHPYLIKVSKAINEFTVDGVTVSSDEDALEINLGSKRKPSSIIGTLIAGTTLENGNLFLSGGKFWYSVGSTKIKGLRAYFNFYDLLPDFEDNYAASRIIISLDGVTRIDGVSIAADGDKVFDLQGRRIEAPAKGIYIKGGKKVVIK